MICKVHEKYDMETGPRYRACPLIGWHILRDRLLASDKKLESGDRPKSSDQQKKHT